MTKRFSNEFIQLFKTTYEQINDYGDFAYSLDDVANILNEKGFKTKRGKPFDRTSLQTLRVEYNIPSRKKNEALLKANHEVINTEVNTKYEEPVEEPLNEIDDNYVFEHDGKIFTNSLYVAKNFDKRHDNVLRDIENIIKKNHEFSLLNFEESSYMNLKNKSQPMYLMTKQGFSILAMGFTTDKAFEFKIKYIQKFEEMEKLINSRALPKPKTTLELLEEAVIELKNKEKLLQESKKQIEEKQKEINTIIPKLNFFENSLIKESETLKLSDLGTFLGQTIKEMGRNKISTYLLSKELFYRKKSGDIRVKSDYLKDPTPYFYTKCYTLTFDNPAGNFSKDCVEIRITRLGLKVLFDYFVSDGLLEINNYNKLFNEASKMFIN